jgi:hypothetical protein
MFYYLVLRAQQNLFSTEKDAFHLLQACQHKLTACDCILIDYLLLPHSLQLIVQGTITCCRTNAYSIDQIEEHQLLSFFGKVGKLGKNYPFCGTYELYHCSNCYAALGKAGSCALPFPLSVILKVKRRQSSKSLLAIVGDEIA